MTTAQQKILSIVILFFTTSTNIMSNFSGVEGRILLGSGQKRHAIPVGKITGDTGIMWCNGVWLNKPEEEKPLTNIDKMTAEICREVFDQKFREDCKYKKEQEVKRRQEEERRPEKEGQKKKLSSLGQNEKNREKERCVHFTNTPSTSCGNSPRISTSSINSFPCVCPDLDKNPEAYTIEALFFKMKRDIDDKVSIEKKDEFLVKNRSTYSECNEVIQFLNQYQECYLFPEEN